MELEFVIYIKKESWLVIKLSEIGKQNFNDEEIQKKLHNKRFLHLTNYQKS